MRVIDADALEERLNRRLNALRAENGDYDHYTDGYEEAVCAVEDFSDGNAVEVVRCKDCKYAVKAKWNKKGYRICPASHMEITDDDFCSCGERNGT